MEEFCCSLFWLVTVCEVIGFPSSLTKSLHFFRKEVISLALSLLSSREYSQYIYQKLKKEIYQ